MIRPDGDERYAFVVMPRCPHCGSPVKPALGRWRAVDGGLVRPATCLVCATSYTFGGRHKPARGQSSPPPPPDADVLIEWPRCPRCDSAAGAWNYRTHGQSDGTVTRYRQCRSCFHRYIEVEELEPLTAEQFRNFHLLFGKIWNLPLPPYVSSARR